MSVPVIHVWPGKWGLPSLNADCLAAIILAQILIPGSFEVEECVNPDTSPNGLLPYLTHGLASISSFSGIAKYLANLRANSLPDEREKELLTPTQRAQQVAWLAYVESHLGDILAASFYSLSRNYWTCIRPALAAALPIPQRYYVPDRMRESYSPRLTAAGFPIDDRKEAKAEERARSRGLFSREVEPTQRTDNLQAAKKAATERFALEEKLEKARSHLTLVEHLLGRHEYFFGAESPGALDALVAAHVLLITNPPLPNDLFRALIQTSFPALEAHSKRLLARTLLTSASSPVIAENLANASPYSSAFGLPSTEVPAPPLLWRKAGSASFTSILPLLLPKLSLSRTKPPNKQALSPKDLEEKKQYARARWTFLALSIAAMLQWAAASGLQIQITREGDGQDEELEEVEQEEEDDEEEEILLDSS